MKRLKTAMAAIVATLALFGATGAKAQGNNGGYGFTMWEKVDHTIMIDLTPGSGQFTVTQLPADYNVTNDVLSATDHLYLRYVKDGTFTMGSPSTEFDRTANRETQTTVTLTSGFYVGVYQVTRHQYWRVMGGTSANGVKTPRAGDGWLALRGKTTAGDAPAEVTAAPSGSASFLWQIKDKVAAANGGLSLAFDLPTEAQWEYACRAGTTGTFSFLPAEIIENTDGLTYAQMSDLLLPTLGEYAWYGDSSGNASALQEVGTRLPNPAGLYDMHGNQFDLCRDAYNTLTGHGDLPGGSVSDRLRTDGLGRAVRGGYWRLDAVLVRSAYRGSYTPFATNAFLGFRLCATGAAVP
ncbi:MAG: formylglycine-generating enzyme family protein [Kiritimatiellaeota bacterium]|nr:formylglycine-generating enzyme family protein [Kiritimatiellota bacterium]